ncbi:MAG: hypothetical protein V1837_08215 [Candidatus Woesearchaeota archaeon]
MAILVPIAARASCEGKVCCNNECNQQARCCAPGTSEWNGLAVCGCNSKLNVQCDTMNLGDCVQCICTSQKDCSWSIKDCGKCASCQYDDIANPGYSRCVSSACVSSQDRCLEIGEIDDNECCYGNDLLSNTKPTNCAYSEGAVPLKYRLEHCTGQKCGGTGWECYNDVRDTGCTRCLDCDNNQACDPNIDSDNDGFIDSCDNFDNDACSVVTQGDNCDNKFSMGGIYGKGCGKSNDPGSSYCTTCDTDSDGIKDCQDKCPETTDGCKNSIGVVLTSGDPRLGCPKSCGGQCQNDQGCICESCDQCGSGGGCSFQECTNQCGGQPCYFISQTMGSDKCDFCTTNPPQSCEDYNNAETCNLHPCGNFKCAWTECRWYDIGCKNCRLDTDDDGKADITDNCPNDYNPGQQDQDGDGKGDACEYCKYEKNMFTPETEIEEKCTDTKDNDCDSTGWKSSDVGNSEDCLDADCTQVKGCPGGSWPRVCKEGDDWVSEDQKTVCDEGVPVQCSGRIPCQRRWVRNSVFFCNETHWINKTQCEIMGRCNNGYHFYHGGRKVCNLNTGQPEETFCGDGLITQGEQCDGKNWGSITGCTSFTSFTGGNLECDAGCTFSTTHCTGGDGTCGDGEVQPGEECETNVGLSDCKSLDTFDPGQLSCHNCKYDTTECTKGGQGYCGNAELDGGEQCDPSSGIEPPGCTRFDNFNGGTTTCTECMVDVGGCSGGTSGTCGNNRVNTGEQCDGTDWGHITDCKDFRFLGGVLTCSNDCRFDTSACIGVGSYCGDGFIDPGEDCDGTNWGHSINGCNDVNSRFTGGTLGCGKDCHFDTNKCFAPGQGICGDNQINGGEECDGTNLNWKTCVSFGFLESTNLKCKECKFDTSECTSNQAYDPDSSAQLCEELVPGQQGTCDVQGEYGCWITDGMGANSKCCGDDSTADDWMNKTGLSACSEGGYCLDADCSELLCKNRIMGTGTNCAHELTKCWSETDKACCGDDIQESWSYETNQALNQLLVAQTCYEGKWYDRNQGIITYYGLSTITQ